MPTTPPVRHDRSSAARTPWVSCPELAGAAALNSGRENIGRAMSRRLRWMPAVEIPVGGIDGIASRMRSRRTTSRELDGHRLATVPQVEGELGGVAAQMRLDRERTLEHRRQIVRNGGQPLAQIADLARSSLREHVVRCAAVPHWPAGECVHGHRGEHEDVARSTGSASGRDCGIDVRGRAARRCAIADDPRDTQISQQRQTGAREQHVRGAHVAVDDALVVRVRQRRPDRGEGGDDLAGREPPALSQQIGERTAGREIEHEHHRVRHRDQFVQTDQVRVVEGRQQRRLGTRGLNLRGVTDRQPLQRDRVTGGTDVAAPHLTRTAEAE